MTRQEANEILLMMIAEKMDSNPDFRFGQILVNLGIVNACEHGDNLFYEESEATLKKVQEKRK